MNAFINPLKVGNNSANGRAIIFINNQIVNRGNVVINMRLSVIRSAFDIFMISKFCDYVCFDFI